MKNSLQILCVVFTSLALNGQWVSGQEAPKCTSPSEVEDNGAPSCKTVDNLEYGSCCRWNYNKGCKEGQCCPKYSNGRLYCEKDFNNQTCTMPTCKAMEEDEKCTIEFYGKELPAGITDVRECCRVKGEGKKKEAAQCCIVTTNGPKCDSDFPKDNCDDYKW